MTTAVDLTGKKFATLTVEGYAGKKYGYRAWQCLCECGNRVVLLGSTLRNPELRSCGCLWGLTGKNNKNWRGCGDLSKSYVCSLRNKAKRRQISFNVTIDYLWDLFVKQDGKCALSGKTLSFPQSPKQRSSGNASLDRIDSKKGYEIGNVQWVTKIINFMKQSLSQEEFVAECKQVTRHQENLS